MCPVAKATACGSMPQLCCVESWACRRSASVGTMYQVAKATACDSMPQLCCVEKLCYHKASKRRHHVPGCEGNCMQQHATAVLCRKLGLHEANQRRHHVPGCEATACESVRQLCSVESWRQVVERSAKVIFCQEHAGTPHGDERTQGCQSQG